MRILTAAFAAALATFAAAGSATAQMLCGDRDAVLSRLSAEHKERPTALGLASNGGVLEILTSENGSWTIIVTGANGLTCLLAVGEAWESVPRVALGPSA